MPRSRCCQCGVTIGSSAWWRRARSRAVEHFTSERDWKAFLVWDMVELGKESSPPALGSGAGGEFAHTPRRLVSRIPSARESAAWLASGEEAPNWSLY